jgi:predicted lipoprotein with Yx(FWY)xxD motif
MMGSWSRARIRISSAAALVALALAVAACGSSNSSSSASSAANNAPGSNSAPTGNTVSVGTASGSAGRYLVGVSGRALYLWVADGHDKSVCAGACAKFWPPLTTKAAPVAAGGVTASQLGTITRSGGVKQVTYDGHPLYYFLEDRSKGSLKGQGNDGFGAKWWLVAPSGTAITKSAAATPAAASSSRASGY